MADAPLLTLTRRRFLQGLVGCAALGGATLGYAARIEPFWITTVDRDLPIAHLPRRLDDKTLIQISDLHIGPVVDDRYMADALAFVTHMRPDVLVITGDFMTSDHAEQVPRVDRMLGHLGAGSIATLAVLGNHDYGRSFRDTAAADALCAVLRRHGVTVLRNAAADVQGLTVAGLDDLWSPNFDPGPVLGSLDPAVPNLVLCHNPDALDQPGWHGYRGWVLAGHTHGGQCTIPFWGPPILPVRNKRYTSGHIPLDDGRDLYINPGLGYLKPVRFGVPPQVTRFRLRRA